MPVLEELAARIEAIAGLGISRPGSLFLGILPESPDRAVALIPAPGREPALTLDVDAVGWDRAAVAVWSRDATTSVSAARDAAEAIYADLAKVANEDLSGRRWLLARPTTPPFLLERDEHRRPVFAFNVRIERVPA